MPYGHLEELLRENLELAKANNRLLKRMYHFSVLGTIVRVVVWLILLGVPLYFLSSYIGPVMSALSGGKVTTPSGLFGLPSADQIQQIIQSMQPPAAK